MTTAREPFALLLDLLAAIDDGRPPRPEVREWFVAGVDAWARSASTKPLHEHLGLSRRLRRDYLLARQRDHLDEALQAFVDTHSGSAWDLSAEFVAEVKRFERNADRDPGTSRLQRSLWLAFRVGLPVPMSREHWFFLLKTICVDGSVAFGSDALPSDVQPLESPAVNEPETKDVEAAVTAAKEQWKRDPQLRAEFGDDQAGEESFLAYTRASLAGRVKVISR